MKFGCTKCGACCRLAGDIFKGAGVGFPYQFKEDGVTCEKYDEQAGCTIYEMRPDVCRVDKLAKLYKKECGMNKKQYYGLTIKACNMLMEKLNIDQSFRIKNT